MSIKVLSAAVVGLDGQVVEVEAAKTSGLRNFTIVGLGDVAVKEARERVQAAMKFSDFEFPRGRVIVNLAPADVKKQGTAYDLPIALAILGTTEVFPEQALRGLVVGELALDGAVRPVSCVLLVALAAKAHGINVVYVPRENAPEAKLVSGVTVYPVSSLAQIVRHLQGQETLLPFSESEEVKEVTEDALYDMAQVKGQESVKRALEIAAAGGHNILLFGPPGTGKTLLARTLPTILPPLTHDEALEVTKIHSVAGVLPFGTTVMRLRPFRSPHHTTSSVAIVGGGAVPRPGEISLAHHGVLFMDEFPEFPRSVLEALRQPIEDGVVTVSRAAGTVQYPARFMLVAAMNPCPCGYYSDARRRCTCTAFERVRYRKKVSGPLLDRIDLVVDVPKIGFEKMTSVVEGESSSAIRERVFDARAIQLSRLRAHRLRTNREMSTALVKQFCALDQDGMAFMKTAMDRLRLSPRAFTRILKVARTIADLAHEPRILIAHLAEAVQFRPKLDILG